MSATSKKSIAFYSSTFFKYLISIGVVVVVGDLIWEAYTDSLTDKNVITGIWALVTYIAYFIGENMRYDNCKKWIMWIVLISLVTLAIFIRFF